VFSLLPPSLVALQWHGDTYALPDGAIQLARSEAYEQQAFVVQRAYGLQFHLEVDGALAAAWGDVPAYEQSLRDLLGDGALPRLVAEVRRHEDETTGLARRLFAAWLERVVGLALPLRRAQRVLGEAGASRREKM
jgi:GMP synthase-like glutamine amidotransferase